MEDRRLLKQWYVLHTRSRHESVVSEGLSKKSLEVFLPKIKVRSTRRDRKAMIHIPLFPGYVFLKTDLHPHTHLEIVKTAGVVRLIGTQQGPVPVAEDTIASLKIMVNSEMPIATGHQLQPGDRVVVVNGPLAGVIGTFVRYRNQSRVVVNIEALGQFAGVEVQDQDIEVLPPILA
ncbi:MAG: UpxY family transcription antiterminator [Desulfobacterales bacterium]|jgi:transcription elongation factor/antiterminator RfaH|nr:UpxY family transcription antiterminator [Desulfobacterales bacterium]